ncbi:acyltransferase family protein [Stomatobaculum longum]|uniref:acyltransferase family protein n=1 Tax=Stomatobaculum longum TaxID=796942 RepID=UPI0028EDBDF3|nr:acyltransferase family protein [Stomatobaculum longum]
MAVRTREIDAMKGGLIFFVVLGHFWLPLLNLGIQSINIPFDWIHSFHMPAFVFLSGVFATHALRSPKRLLRRCLMMLWLYIFFKWLVFYPEKIAYHMSGSLPDFWHESGTPWYVLALCFWTLILPLFAFFRRQFGAVWVLLAITAASLRLGYLNQANRFGDYLALDRVFAFAPFFYGGAFLGEQRFQRFLNMKPGFRWLVIGSGTALALWFTPHTRSYLHPYEKLIYGVWYSRLKPETLLPLFRRATWLLRLFWQLGAALIGAAFFLLVKQLVSLPCLEKLFACPGERSLQIYMLHRPIRDLCLAAGYPVLVERYPGIASVTLVVLSLLLTALLSAKPLYCFFRALQKLPEQLLDALHGQVGNVVK